jgi:hypothetical protein
MIQGDGIEDLPLNPAEALMLGDGGDLDRG